MNLLVQQFLFDKSDDGFYLVLERCLGLVSKLIVKLRVLWEDLLEDKEIGFRRGVEGRRRGQSDVQGLFKYLNELRDLVLNFLFHLN